METIKTHVNIPDDRRLVIDLHIPPTIPSAVRMLFCFHGQKEKRPQSSRVLGAFKGQIRIADDFDEPLGDEFWLGANNEFST